MSEAFVLKVPEFQLFNIIVIVR